MFVFVHGAGRSGRAAWPRIDRADAVILDLSATPDIWDQVALVADAIEEDTVVVAHSYGAIAAVLALRSVQRVRALVLAEPALYDIARGNPAVERHISTMEFARGEYDRAGLEAYWRAVRPLMFGGPFDQGVWEAESAMAARFHGIEPPWGHGITAGEIVRTPTTVVTGGWNAEYEAIGAALAAEGATHRVLPGAGHRPQDLPAFGALLVEVDARR